MVRHAGFCITVISYSSERFGMVGIVGYLHITQLIYIFVCVCIFFLLDIAGYKTFADLSMFLLHRSLQALLNLSPQKCCRRPIHFSLVLSVPHHMCAFFSSSAAR